MEECHILDTTMQKQSTKYGELHERPQQLVLCLARMYFANACKMLGPPE